MTNDIAGIIIRKDGTREDVVINVQATPETLDQLAREIDELFQSSEIEKVWKGVPYDQQTESSRKLRQEWARGAWLLGARPRRMPAAVIRRTPGECGCPTHHCNREE